MSINDEQPPPAPADPAKPACWDLVIADLADYFTTDNCKRLLIEDMRARDAKGRAQYGCPLQPFNGRDALIDAFQEALDQCVYLKQAAHEAACVSSASLRRSVDSLYRSALRQCCDLRELLLARDSA